MEVQTICKSQTFISQQYDSVKTMEKNIMNSYIYNKGDLHGGKTTMLYLNRCTDKTPQVKNPQDKTPQTKPPKPKTPNTKTPKTKPPNKNYIRTKPPNIYLFSFIFGCCFVVYLVLGVSFKP